MKRIVFLFALAVGLATVLPSISIAHDHLSHGNPAYGYTGGHGYSVSSDVSQGYYPSDGYGGGFQVPTPHFNLRTGH